MYTAVYFIIGFVIRYLFCILGKTTLIMSNQYNNPDSLDSGEFDAPKLPTGLNVLTILTFIGSAFGLYFTVSGFLTAETSYQKKDEIIAQMKSPEMPEMAKRFLPPMDHFEEMMTKSYENRWPLFILGLLATALCLYGALQMRKLKKTRIFILCNRTTSAIYNNHIVYWKFCFLWGHHFCFRN